jgi:hypothetical protein
METVLSEREVPPSRIRPPLRLWREAVYVGVFYGLYWLVRNSQGSNKEATKQAFTNAKRVMQFERWTGMFHEETIQEAFLHATWFVKILNAYYGIAHFLVTIWALVWCYRNWPDRYRVIRNGLAFMTGIALFGFFLFPLMPPRLLPEHYGFVDTLIKIGSPWNFESGPVAKVSNQFAAMPSLHFGWSAWCAVTFWPWARNHTWRKVVLVGYPLLTLFAIVVTGNHYILDAVGGFVVFALGLRMGTVLDRVGVIDIWRNRSRKSTSSGA